MIHCIFPSNYYPNSIDDLLTCNSINLSIGQTSSNAGNMGTEAVSQQMDIVERITELLLRTIIFKNIKVQMQILTCLLFKKQITGFTSRTKIL